MLCGRLGEHNSECMYLGVCLYYVYVYACVGVGVCVYCVYICTCLCTRVCCIYIRTRLYDPDPVTKDSDLCSLWTRYTGDSKTDPRDNPKIRAGSGIEDQTAVRI